MTSVSGNPPVKDTLVRTMSGSFQFGSFHSDAGDGSPTVRFMVVTGRPAGPDDGPFCAIANLAMKKMAIAAAIWDILEFIMQSLVSLSPRTIPNQPKCLEKF